MQKHDTSLVDAYVFEPKVWEDERGYFFESYNRRTANELGLSTVFVQDNEAYSTKGILRGLHYQHPPYAQAKLVRVLLGSVQDVIVDLRPVSPTYGKHFSIILSADNKKQLFVPRGFAHGYLVLSDEAIFCYKCDNYYDKSSEGGLRYDDPALNIDWQLPTDQIVVNDKDLAYPAITLSE